MSEAPAPTPRPLMACEIEILQYLNGQQYPVMIEVLGEHIQKSFQIMIWNLVSGMKTKGLITVITYRNKTRAVEITEKGKISLAEEIEFARNGSG